MACRFSIPLLLLAALCRFAPADDPPIVRGVFLKDEMVGVQLWVPAGLDRAKIETEDAGAGPYRTLGRFLGKTGGFYTLLVVKAPEKDADTFFDRLKGSLRKRYPDCSPERVEVNARAGGRPAIVVCAKRVEMEDGVALDVSFFAVSAASDCLVYAVGYHRHQDEARARAQIRWMLGTVTRTGPGGLDWYLGPRRIDLESGLVTRTPHDGFIEQAREAGTRAEQWVDPKTGDRLKIATSTEKALTRILEDPALGSRQGNCIDFQHPVGFKAVGAFYVSGDRVPKTGRAVLAVAVEPLGTVTVTATGHDFQRARLMRTVEFVSYGLDWLDVPAARADATVSAAGLRRALSGKDRASVAAYLARLSKLTFLESARGALGKAFTRLEDEGQQVEVARRLADARSLDVRPYLERALSDTRVKRSARVVTAVLEGLGRLGAPESITVLLRFADRGEHATRATAVRALGGYAEKKDRIAKELLRRLKRLVAGAVRGEPDYEKLKEAYRDAFRSLLGARSGTVDEVEALIRRMRD